MLNVVSQARREMSSIAVRDFCLRQISGRQVTRWSAEYGSQKGLGGYRTNIVRTCCRHVVRYLLPPSTADDGESVVVAGPAVVVEGVEGEGEVGGGEDDEVEVA